MSALFASTLSYVFGKLIIFRFLLCLGFGCTSLLHVFCLPCMFFFFFLFLVKFLSWRHRVVMWPGLGGLRWPGGSSLVCEKNRHGAVVDENGKLKAGWLVTQISHLCHSYFFYNKYIKWQLLMVYISSFSGDGSQRKFHILRSKVEGPL